MASKIDVKKEVKVKTEFTKEVKSNSPGSSKRSLRLSTKSSEVEEDEESDYQPSSNSNDQSGEEEDEKQMKNNIEDEKYPVFSSKLQKSNKRLLREMRLAMPCPFCGVNDILEVENLELCMEHVSDCVDFVEGDTLSCPICKDFPYSKAEISNFTKHVLRCRNPWRQHSLACSVCLGDRKWLYLEFVTHIHHYHQHPFICTQCPRRLASFEDSQTHFKTSHAELYDVTPQNDMYKEDIISGNFPSVPWLCPVCFEEFPEECLRDLHVSNEHQPLPRRTENCALCTQVYYAPEELRMHHILAHPSHFDKVAISCYICHQFFTGQKAYREHRVKKHRLDAVKCDQCDKEYFCRKALRHHKLFHDQGRPKDMLGKWICTVEGCGKLFKGRRPLLDHGKNEHNLACNGACAICCKLFENMNAARLHKAEVHNLRLYRCEVAGCEMVYNRDYELLKHVSKFHDQKMMDRCRCRKCGKGFYFLSYCERHEVNCIGVNDESKPSKRKRCTRRPSTTANADTEKKRDNKGIRNDIPVDKSTKIKHSGESPAKKNCNKTNLDSSASEQYDPSNSEDPDGSDEEEIEVGKNPSNLLDGDRKKHEIFDCPACGKEFIKLSVYKWHVIQNHEDVICIHCGEHFRSVWSLREHVEHVH